MAECLALERINRLLDEGSFVEVGALVSARMTDFTVNDQSAPSDGVITGYGQIEGNPVYVYSQNRDVLNGTMGEMHAKKIAKLYDMADKAAAPVIGLLDCGGFRLQESVDALDSFGTVLAKQAEYADSVLQISAVMGNCAGGMTLIPAMSDFAFMTKEAQMYVNAPHTIQDNKKLSREFNSADYQAAVSGQAEVLESEDAVLTKIRELVVMLIDEEYGRCGEDDLNRYISEKTCAMKDARALLGECADDKFLEIRPDYAPEMVTGFLTLNGILVGAVANADALYDEKGEKTADLADGLAGAPDFMMINVGVHVHDVFAHFDRHDHFFQRAVAGAFADTVHRTFYLARTGVDRGEGVTDSDAQIIMGVDGNNCFVDIRHAIIQAADDVGIFERHGITDGIRDINGGGAGVDRRLHDASQIGNRRTAGVFTGELNVVSVVACPLHHIDRALNNLIQRTAQFGGDMHRRGGNKGMNTESLGHF